MTGRAAVTLTPIDVTVLAVPTLVVLSVRNSARICVAPLTPPAAAFTWTVATPLASVSTALLDKEAMSGFTVLRSTTEPATGMPKGSVTRTVSVAGLMGVTIVDDRLKPRL